MYFKVSNLKHTHVYINISCLKTCILISLLNYKQVLLNLIKNRKNYYIGHIVRGDSLVRVVTEGRTE